MNQNNVSLPHRKYLHIFPKSIFLRYYLELLDKYFDVSEHEFILLQECHSNIVSYPKSFSRIRSIVPKRIIQMALDPRVLNMAYRADLIVCHSLSPESVLLLSTHPLLIKKSVWVVWGYDLYDYREKTIIYQSWLSKVYFSLKKVLAKRIEHVFAQIPDRKLLRAWYHSPATFYMIQPLYCDSNLLLPCRKRNTLQNNPINILVGNSATKTNRHLDILHLVNRFVDYNICLYIPLAYGDLEYADYIKELAKSLFQDKVVFLDTFTPFPEYKSILNSMDVAIFNQNRQQGVSNLITLFSSGCKIYLNEDSPNWDIFAGDGFIFYPISSLTYVDYNSFIFMSEEDSESNSVLAHTVYSQSHSAEGWKNVFGIVYVTT